MWNVYRQQNSVVRNEILVFQHVLVIKYMKFFVLTLRGFYGIFYCQIQSWSIHWIQISLSSFILEIFVLRKYKISILDQAISDRG